MVHFALIFTAVSNILLVLCLLCLRSFPTVHTLQCKCSFRCVCFAQASHSVHVFSVNGVNLGSKYVSGQVTWLAVAGDHLVVVDDAGDLTMSRILG